MGSYSEPRNKGIDTSVGSLVWVRRRNGSWWPGLVMPPDGLQKRRKGAPVKLLGKEDGSMDWYDLERSKRIKAFRCGEYDECIRKAKVSAQRPNKADRMGRYARREDAIIHALELEQICNSIGDRNFYTGTIQLTGATVKRGFTKEQSDSRKNSTKGRNKMTTEVSPSVISSEQNKAAVSCKVQAVKKRKWRTLNDNVDVEIKEMTHTNNFRDIDLGVKSRSMSGIINGIRSREQDILDDFSATGSSFGSNFAFTGPVNHVKNFGSSKRGRKIFNLCEASKRKNRCRPLTEVLESTARVNLPSSYSQDGPGPQGQQFLLGSVQNNLATMDSSESKKTDLSVVINNSSEYSENSCDDVSGAREVTNGLAVKEACLPFSNGLSSTFANISDGYFDDLFEVPIFLEENTDFYSHILPSLKRKLSPRSENVCGIAAGRVCTHIEPEGTNLRAIFVGEADNTSISRWHVKGKRTSLGGSAVSKGGMDTAHPSQVSGRSHEIISGLDDRIEQNSANKMLESNNGFQLMSCGLVSCEVGHQPLKQTTKVPDIVCASFHSCARDEPGDCSNAECENSFLECCETNEMQEELSHPKVLDGSLAIENVLNENLKSGINNSSVTLFEVKVDVQAAYKKPHVPLVSFTSKVNGKTIVGHSVAIQILDGSSLDALILRKCRAIPGNRTIMSKGAANKFSCVGRRKNQKLHRKKQGQHLQQFPSASRSKSSEIRKPKFSPRKIRKLSSITVDGGMKEKKRVQAPDKLREPVVTCIPIKNVFARISQSLGFLSRQDGCA